MKAVRPAVIFPASDSRKDLRCILNHADLNQIEALFFHSQTIEQYNYSELDDACPSPSSPQNPASWAKYPQRLTESTFTRTIVDTFRLFTQRERNTSTPVPLLCVDALPVIRFGFLGFHVPTPHLSLLDNSVIDHDVEMATSGYQGYCPWRCVFPGYKRLLAYFQGLHNKQ